MSKIINKRNLLIILTIAVLIATLYFIVPVSIPIILALLTATMIEPLVRLFERKMKLSRKLSVISVYIIVLGFIIMSLYFITNTLIGKIVEFVKNAPAHINTITHAWNEAQTFIFNFSAGMPEEFLKALQVELNKIIINMRDSLINLLSYDRLTTIAAEIPNLLVSLIVFMIALFLFMLELPQLKQTVFNHLKESTAQKVSYMNTKLKLVLVGFIKAQLMVSIIIFIVAFIGLLLIIPKYALVMAIVIWIIDIIPILGSIIVLAPWAMYAFIMGDTALGTQLSILAIILLVIRRTVEPKVMGSQIGLSPLPTLIAMFIGLKLFGFLGFFIGPLIVILFTTAREAEIIKINFKV